MNLCWVLYFIGLQLAFCGKTPPKAQLRPVIEGDPKIELDPSVQNIPINASLANLRPPPPVLVVDPTIFIGLSVFRDGFRCGITVFTGFKRATYPDRLTFGIVDQLVSLNDTNKKDMMNSDVPCIDAYCDLAKVEWPNHGPCRYKDQIRVDVQHASDSRGPTWARAKQQKLIDNQDFCLQLDAHSVFTNNWDDFLIADWVATGNEMAVLTTYLHDLHDFILPNGTNKMASTMPHLCMTTRGTSGMIRTIRASMISNSVHPQMQALWGAGLSFNKCHAEKRVPVDSHTPWMFDGEEYLRSSHLWTSGYDMYSPTKAGMAVYHNYTKVPSSFQHIKVDAATKKREVMLSTNRFKHLVGMNYTGEADLTELKVYSYSNVRSYASYLEFSGINFTNVNDTLSCRQLHWVPYEKPREVEKLIGWKMNIGPSADSFSLSEEEEEVKEDDAAVKDNKEKKVQADLVETDEKDDETKMEPNLDIKGKEAQTDSKANKNDKSEEIKKGPETVVQSDLSLRRGVNEPMAYDIEVKITDTSSPLLSISLVILMVFILAGVLVYSNDALWFRMKRLLHPKKSS